MRLKTPKEISAASNNQIIQAVKRAIPEKNEVKQTFNITAVIRELISQKRRARWKKTHFIAGQTILDRMIHKFKRKIK